MKNVISKNATVVLLIQYDKTPKTHSTIQLGFPHLQFQERRSIALWRDGDVHISERHLASFPVNIDRTVFQKDETEKQNIKFDKKDWKNEQGLNYKPQLLIRA